MASIKRDIPVGNQGYVVHVTGNINGKKSFVLHGYARNKNGVKLKGTQRKVIVTDVRDLELSVTKLVNKVSQALPKPSRSSHNSKALSSSSQMESALNYLEDNSIRISELWSPNTQSMHLVYFRRNILPYLDKNGDTWTSDSKDALINLLIESVLVKEQSSKDYLIAKRTVKNHLSAAHRIYQKLRSVEPTLPDIDLYPYFGRIAQREQIKSIPEEVRRNLIAWIESFVAVNPRIAAAAALMFGCGLRTAEAAGVLPKQVVIYKSGCTSVNVHFQAKGDHLTGKLKTLNSYRLVPLSAWVEDIVFRCFDLITFSDEKKPLCDPNQLSSRLRSALMACGLSRDYLIAAEAAMDRVITFEAEDRDLLGGISAYVLRRDWATRARNYCGLSTDEIDYLLGHKRVGAKKRRKDFRHDEDQTILSNKLERYIASLAVSNHPALSPMQIASGGTFMLQQYTIMRIRNDTASSLQAELDIEASLSAEPITLVVQQGNIQSSTKRSIPTEGKLRNPEVIGEQNRIYIKEDGNIVYN